MMPRLLVTSIRIFPDRLAAMLLWGIVCGMALGAVWEVFRVTRVLLGVRYPSRGADALYHKPLPLLRLRPRPCALRRRRDISPLALPPRLWYT
jgi:hypothetical protein